MKVVALVPLRLDGGPRDAAWSWVCRRWHDKHPDIFAYPGAHGEEEGPFNRSLALNRASNLANKTGQWDVAVIMDADSFVEPLQIKLAVEVAATMDRLTMAHDRYNYLSPRGSERVMQGHPPGMVRFFMENTLSSMLAVPRPLWDELHGFDPGFMGWGMEDAAFYAAARELRGGCERVSGPVWHLWHPTSTHPQEGPNVDRLHLYEQAAGREAMLKLIEELR